MREYRKINPTIVNAVQFDGENHKDCETFLCGNYDNTLNYPNIITADGIIEVGVGDYLYKDEYGKFNVSKMKDFELRYEEVMPRNVIEAQKIIKSCTADYGFMGSPQYDEANKVVSEYKSSTDSEKMAIDERLKYLELRDKYGNGATN